MSVTRFTAVLALLLVIAAGSLFAGAQKEQTTGKNDLIIHHWWTAGGEKEAIDAVLEGFQKKYPEVNVIQNPVAGGGGMVMQAQIKTMIMAGESPDTFQVLLGTGQLEQWVNVLEPIDDIWDGYNVDPVLEKMVTDGGHQYGIPINIHTSNILWYNKKVAGQVGVGMPLSSLSEVYQVSDKAKGAGYVPIAFGAAASQKLWWIHLAAQIMCLIPDAGAEYLQKLYAGKADPARDSQVRQVLESMKTIIDNGYINNDYSALTWDQAGNLLRTDKALLYPMGDWAKGLFTSSGWKPKTDFDFQLSRGIQAFHCDFFALAKNAPHKESVRKWLAYIKTEEAQTIFNPIKGSIPPLLNAPIDPYDPISKDLIAIYRDASKKHIEDSDAAPPAGNNEAFGDMYSIFATQPNIDSGVKAFTQAYQQVYKK